MLATTTCVGKVSRNGQIPPALLAIAWTIASGLGFALQMPPLEVPFLRYFAGVLVVVGPKLQISGGVYELVMLGSAPLFAASALITKALTCWAASRIIAPPARYAPPMRPPLRALSFSI